MEKSSLSLNPAMLLTAHVVFPTSTEYDESEVSVVNSTVLKNEYRFLLTPPPFLFTVF